MLIGVCLRLSVGVSFGAVVLTPLFQGFFAIDAEAVFQGDIFTEKVTEESMIISMDVCHPLFRDIVAFQEVDPEISDGFGVVEEVLNLLCFRLIDIVLHDEEISVEDSVRILPRFLVLFNSIETEDLTHPLPKINDSDGTAEGFESAFILEDIPDDLFVRHAFFSPNIDQGFGSGGVDGDIGHGLEGIFRVFQGIVTHGFAFLAVFFRAMGFCGFSGMHSV